MARYTSTVDDAAGYDGSEGRGSNPVCFGVSVTRRIVVRSTDSCRSQLFRPRKGIVAITPDSDATLENFSHNNWVRDHEQREEPVNAKSWTIVGICAVIVWINISYLTKKEESERLSGSCMTPKMNDGSKVCMEYSAHEKTKEFKQLCEPAMRGTWTDGPCDTQGSLGGCQTGDNKMWFFPAGKFKSSGDVESFCARKDLPYLEP